MGGRIATMTVVVFKKACQWVRPAGKVRQNLFSTDVSWLANERVNYIMLPIRRLLENDGFLVPVITPFLWTTDRDKHIGKQSANLHCMETTGPIDMVGKRLFILVYAEILIIKSARTNTRHRSFVEIWFECWETDSKAAFYRFTRLFAQAESQYWDWDLCRQDFVELWSF